jgi:hypothetical protein
VRTGRSNLFAFQIRSAFESALGYEIRSMRSSCHGLSPRASIRLRKLTDIRRSGA